VNEETAKLLTKAESAVRAAQILLDHEEIPFAAGRAYYAMFYVAEALLHERGRRFNKHSGVHAAYGKEFAKTGLLDPKYHGWLLRAFDQRIEGDYQADTMLTADEAATTLERAREFLATARSFLAQADQTASETTDS